MELRVHIYVLVLCLGLALCLTAPVNAGMEESPKTGPMAAENVQRGMKLYEQSCGFCHGPAAKGTSTGPSLINSSLVRHDKDGDLISKVVQQGRVEKGMPSFPVLSPAQISDIVAYLHALVIVSDSVDRDGPVGGYSFKHLLTGDAAAGKAYFNGEGKCSNCHSPSKDLAGIASKYEAVDLESRFLYPPAEKTTATVNLPSGKQVKGKLLYLDAFYVSLSDYDGHYHSWSLPGVKVQVEDPLKEHLALLGKYKDKDIHDVFAYLETLK